jgi:predicted Zn-dependent protease
MNGVEYPLRLRRYALVMLVLAMACGAAPLCKARPSALESEQNQRTKPLAEQSEIETELRAGIDLTRQGKFGAAIPHFLAVRGRVSDEYAVEFNLALCYVGTGQFRDAILVLAPLSSNHDGASVQNLLAQAYVGTGQPEEAFAALQRAAAFTPNDEKLYGFVADACADHQQYAPGLRVIDLGLTHLPNSARLHFQRGYFLSLLDQLNLAFTEFDAATHLAPETEIGYLSMAEKNFLQGNLVEVIRVGREAEREGRGHFLLLSILGEALIRRGVVPGEAEFTEAKSALEKSVAQKATYASSQAALGYLYLTENRLGAAIEHLEVARRLNPRNPAVYSRLALAYRRQGQTAEADAAIAALAQLNAQEAARINSAPGDSKAIAGASIPRP